MYKRQLLTHAAVRRIAGSEAYSGARKAPACEAAHRYPARCLPGMRPCLLYTSKQRCNASHRDKRNAYLKFVTGHQLIFY